MRRVHDLRAWRGLLRKLIREIENFPVLIIAMIERGAVGRGRDCFRRDPLSAAAYDVIFVATSAKLNAPYNAGAW